MVWIEFIVIWQVDAAAKADECAVLPGTTCSQRKVLCFCDIRRQITALFDKVVWRIGIGIIGTRFLCDYWLAVFVQQVSVAIDFIQDTIAGSNHRTFINKHSSYVRCQLFRQRNGTIVASVGAGVAFEVFDVDFESILHVGHFPGQ